MSSNRIETQKQKISYTDFSDIEDLIQSRETGDILWEAAVSLPYSDEAARDAIEAKYEEAFEIYTACYEKYYRYKEKYGNTQKLINNQKLMLSVPPGEDLCVVEHLYFLTKTLADAHYEMGDYSAARSLYLEAQRYLDYCHSCPQLKKNINQYLHNSHAIFANLEFNAALSRLRLVEQMGNENNQNMSILQDINIADEATQVFITSLQHTINDNTAKAYQKYIAADYVLRSRILFANAPFDFISQRDRERLKWCIIEILNAKQLYALVKLPANAPLTLHDLLNQLAPPLSPSQLTKLETYFQPIKQAREVQSIHEYAKDIAKKMYQFTKSDKYTQLKLLPHQQEALARIATHFADSNTKAGITMATGAGKTHVFISFLLAAQAMVPDGLDHESQAFIVVPQLTLSNQTFYRTQQLMQACQLSCDIGIFNGKKKSQHKITIITLDSLQSEMRKPPKQRQLNIDCCKLMVFDEIHLALSEKCKELIFELSATKLILTLTATDTYNTRRLKGALRSVKELIGQENCIYHYPILNAIEDKVLAPLRVCIVHGISEVPQRVLHNITKDVDLKKIEERLNQDNFFEINTTVTEQYLHVVHPDTGEPLVGKQGFAFCVSIRHAETLASKLNDVLREHAHLHQSNIVPAAVISGHLSGEEQTRLLEAFKRGEILILCGADILITGIDAPSVEILFNLRPTRSIVLAEQRLGRVTRLTPTNPGKIGLIFEYLMVAKQVLASHFLNNKQYAGSLPALTDIKLEFKRTQIQINQRINGACQWTLSWGESNQPVLQPPIRFLPTQQPISLPRNRQLPAKNALPATAFNHTSNTFYNAATIQYGFFKAVTPPGFKRFPEALENTASKRPRLETTTSSDILSSVPMPISTSTSLFRSSTLTMPEVPENIFLPSISNIFKDDSWDTYSINCAIASPPAKTVSTLSLETNQFPMASTLMEADGGLANLSENDNGLPYQDFLLDPTIENHEENGASNLFRLGR